jgi:uncharacterized protein YggU (UPF0235/DUF167 family)
MRVVVHVTPDSRKESIAVGKRGAIEIHVREPAQENRANKRTTVLLTRHLKVPAESVRLVAGHRAQKKTFELQK